MQFIGFVLLGLLAGGLSGVAGIGGGIIIVPALIYWFGYSQHLAQGTSLALMVLPLGLMAGWNFYQKGYVNTTAVLVIGAGFVIGSYLSSKIAIDLSDATIRRAFAVILGIIAISMFLQNSNSSSG